MMAFVAAAVAPPLGATAFAPAAKSVVWPAMRRPWARQDPRRDASAETWQRQLGGDVQPDVHGEPEWQVAGEREITVAK